MVWVFEVVEASLVAEGEVALAGVEQVEDDHFVPQVAEVAQSFEDLVGRVEQVGEHDDEAAAADALGEVVEGRGHARLVVRPRLVDGLEKDLEVALH